VTKYRFSDVTKDFSYFHPDPGQIQALLTAGRFPGLYAVYMDFCPGDHAADISLPACNLVGNGGFTGCCWADAIQKKIAIDSLRCFAK
jgi:hypothetical protein